MIKNKKSVFLLVLYLVFFLFFYNFPFGKIFKFNFFLGSEKSEAYYTPTIDGTVLAGANRTVNERAPNVVSIGTTGVVYSFGADSDGTCVYWKSTDAGTTWSAAASLYAGTDCLGTTVWYDRWTPGDTTGNYIHIVFGDDSDEDLYYERLDTTNDTQIGETNITDGASYNAGLSLLKSNSYSIAKGTDGDLYMATSDDGDSFVIKCTGSCNTAGNWSEAGTNIMDAAEDEVILKPLASGDIMLINWDISAEIVRDQVYTDATNSWAGVWTTIMPATDIGTIKHYFDAAVNTANNNVYLCVNNAAASSYDIITGTFNGSTWSTSTSLVGTYNGCSINYDSAGNIFWLATTEVIDIDVFTYVASSTDSMVSFSGLTTVYEVAEDTLSGLSFNPQGYPYLRIYDATASDFIGVPADNLMQTAYRWQNDNSAPNSNTAMAAANTAITDVKIGQRLTARIQLGDSGGVTSTVYSLQYCSGAASGDSCSSWNDMTTSTAISTTSGSSTNATAITAQTAGAFTGLTWKNGTWHEATANTNSFTMNTALVNNYTEFGFMIGTANAAANTTYYLRLYNKSANRTLNNYLYYPTLTTIATDNNSRFSFDPQATLANSTSSLNFYFDDLEYSRSSSSDNTYATTTAQSQYTHAFMFAKKNTNSTDQITYVWEGQISLGCSALSPFKIDVFNKNSGLWENKVTDTTCSASTDFTSTTTITTSLGNYYDNNWTYWRAYWASDAPGVSVNMLTDYISFTFSTPYILTQTSYRFQNDDNPADNNTAIANANTALTNVKIGQRLTARMQIKNTGASATTTNYLLQYCSGADPTTCSPWNSVSTSTPISSASSPGAATASSTISSQVAGDAGVDWTNGAWYEETATSSNQYLGANNYTELGYVLDTHNAAVNTTYYLRLYNTGSSQTLDTYTNYPTLTMVASDTTRYAKDSVAALSAATTTPTYYLDNAGYTNVGTSDDSREYSTSTTAIPEFFFASKNSNSTDQMAINWEGQSNVACSSKAIYLQVYNIYTAAWVTKDSSTSCGADTDFALTATIDGSLSPNYYDSGWTYWRVYQASGTEVLQTDLYSPTFSANGSASNYNLTQTAYRFYDDLNPVAGNTALAAANTAITDIKIGERLTARFQLKNTGILSTTTSFVLQYCTGTALPGDCVSWNNLSTTTPVGNGSSPASISSGTALTGQSLGSVSGLTWTNGAWYEQTPTSSDISLPTEYYTELAFIIQTGEASANTKYFLRLYNTGSNIVLDTYSNYPTLTIISADQGYRYSKGFSAALPATNAVLAHYLDATGFTAVGTSDDSYDSITGSSSYPAYLFAKENANSTDNISFSFEGQSDTACASSNIIIKIYNFTTAEWETLTTNASCLADTDFTSIGAITSSQTSYYSSNWTYFLVYQDTGNPTLKTDYLAFTFSTPPSVTPSPSTPTPGGSGLPPMAFMPPAPPPGGYQIKIDGASGQGTLINPITVNSLSVILNFNASSDIKGMAISFDPNFTYANWEDYSSIRLLTLPNNTPGLKTVYVKFYTAYGQPSAAQSVVINYQPEIIILPPVLNQNNSLANLIPASIIFKKNYSLNKTSNDIKQLQIFLNANGYLVAKTGPGSPGKETTKFGSLTKKAVIKFQEAFKDLILKPQGLKKGNGVLGPGTRGVINSIKK